MLPARNCGDRESKWGGQELRVKQWVPDGLCMQNTHIRINSWLVFFRVEEQNIYFLSWWCQALLPARRFFLREVEGRLWGCSVELLRAFLAWETKPQFTLNLFCCKLRPSLLPKLQRGAQWSMNTDHTWSGRTSQPGMKGAVWELHRGLWHPASPPASSTRSPPCHCRYGLWGCPGQRDALQHLAGTAWVPRRISQLDFPTSESKDGAGKEMEKGELICPRSHCRLGLEWGAEKSFNQCRSNAFRQCLWALQWE